MLCSDFELRLYDEDSRDSLEGRSAMPADIRDHLAQCPDCRALWDEAIADTRAFSEALALSPPAHLQWSGFAIGAATVLAGTTVSRLQLGGVGVWPVRLLAGSLTLRRW